MPFEVVLVNFVVRPSASQVLLSCAGHHLAHDTLILNDFTLVNYFWFPSFITTRGRTPSILSALNISVNTPSEGSQKGFLHICKFSRKFLCLTLTDVFNFLQVLISLKALVKWNCPSFPRLVVLRSLWNLRLELNSCLPSIALSERTSSSQHSTLWEHQYPTIPTQYSKQEHGNCIIGTKVLR